MYLAKIKIQNFRNLQDVDICLNKGLNILLGENDSGKTALIDAIRLVLGTRDYDRTILTKEDFFVDPTGRANNLKIQLEFEDLLSDEAPHFLEWIGIRNKKVDDTLEYFLRVTLNASRKEVNQLINKYDREVNFSITAGPDDVGTNLPSELRDLLRATYLKPLRDAEQELSSRKGSRLSQILIAHPEIRQQDNSIDKDSIPGIIHSANAKVREHPSIRRQADVLNHNYLSNFILGDESISASINISDPSLRGILERLELSLVDSIPNIQMKHGLGLSNLLFMATELLLLGSSQSAALPLLLIEEPEAHLHPQLQIRLMQFLQQKAVQQEEIRSVQIIVTSHSPNLASRTGLENVTLVHSGRLFSLGKSYTCLDHSDYKFLERFLDVTKANLFFARGVIIVEGGAEQILLPTIARLIGFPFEKYGVSIVNVGSVGLFRYARIFQRKDGKDIGIRVACLADMDLPPDDARRYLWGENKQRNRPTQSSFNQEQITQQRTEKENRSSGGPVRAFVSSQWTLEYDLCIQSPDIALLVYQAIQLAKVSKKNLDGITSEEKDKIKKEAYAQFEKWKETPNSEIQIATNIYEELFLKRASKPETAQFLVELLDECFENTPPENLMSVFPDYIVSAIKYVTGQS